MLPGVPPDLRDNHLGAFLPGYLTPMVQMGIEKEREAFENLWLAGGGNFDNFIFSEDQGKYAAIENSNLTDKQKEMKKLDKKLFIEALLLKLK